MAQADRNLGMYLHLARASHVRHQPMVRDKLLVLAGVQAEEMGLEPISALCRQKILAHNARHLVGQWPTITAALANDQFQSYLKQLRRRYAPEKIEHMLASLGIELGRERDAYFDNLEYAAALLDTTPEAIALTLSERGDQPGNGQASAAADSAGPEAPAATIVTVGPAKARILLAVAILLALLAIAVLLIILQG